MRLFALKNSYLLHHGTDSHFLQGILVYKLHESMD